MNVNDVTESVEIKGDRLDMIFQRQLELAQKYHHIEASSGLLQTQDFPVNLHDPKGQARLKDFAWRVTEELAEALDALKHSDGVVSIHSLEEIADSFHFLVEMALLSGLGVKSLIPSTVIDGEQERDFLSIIWEGRWISWVNRSLKPTISTSSLKFISQLGMVCHTLKNKPWKQTHMLTDTAEYQKRFVDCFYSFIDVCIAFGMTPQDLFDLYFKKSEVNKFRQRSKY